jgi:hypothetical protein
MGGIYEVMKYSVEMGSVAMIYIPSYIRNGSALQKLTRATQRHTDIIAIQ